MTSYNNVTIYSFEHCSFFFWPFSSTNFVKPDLFSSLHKNIPTHVGPLKKGPTNHWAPRVIAL